MYGLVIDNKFARQTFESHGVVFLANFATDPCWNNGGAVSFHRQSRGDRLAAMHRNRRRERQGRGLPENGYRYMTQHAYSPLALAMKNDAFEDIVPL